ncbi:hypothetical protein [Streptomyces anulatus]|uniref:hypothetical protein n=1 Tax=Streptomyces anulatus TaxID=1892 RepID=UPI0036588B43
MSAGELLDTGLGGHRHTDEPEMFAVHGGLHRFGLLVGKKVLDDFGAFAGRFEEHGLDEGEGALGDGRRGQHAAFPRVTDVRS